MKFVAALVCLLATANAYTAPLMATKVLKSKTKPVAKKVAKAGKAAPRSSGGSSVGAAAWANAGPSTALPFATSPATLDGSMLGDVGFDPFGFSTTPVGPWFLGNTIPSQGVIGDLEWYREAEIIHGRIAQIAVLGFLGPELFGTLPGNDWTGADAYSNTNPLEAFSQVPGLALTQIFLFMSFLEIRRLNIIKEEGRNFQPGDLRIGQGANRWNPFGLNYSPAEYEEKRLQELKHCRLAMIGVFGLAAQANASGMGVLEQLGGGLAIPNYVSKAGYFFPDGI
ncbi:hypothetical protein TrLO_g14531 [Triparma laevis f. longispina]|uniref:Chlorophyll a-b binding protein, chloroplastic n=1 Tax=Triparma laevis f. longispina TaxID=1714387 RepID=A0A9W7AJ02_9STRA|nr:hypothetical protein TrLO_g14531 [Triparma laevis f. longispina]